MRCLRREVPGVSTSVSRRNGCQLGTRRNLNGLASVVPVKVPLQKRIVGRVELSSLLSSGNRSIVVTTLDGNVEGLRPELPL